MPLLSRRRSVLDLLNQMPGASRSEDTSERPKTSALEPPPSTSPRPRSEYGLPTSRLSHEVLHHEIPDPPGAGRGDGSDGGNRSKRFSMLRFRNLSEPHLSTMSRENVSDIDSRPPPLPTMSKPHSQTPAPPALIRTAPTMETHEHAHQSQRQRRTLFKRSPSKRAARAVQDPRKFTGVGEGGDKPKASSLKWRRMQGRSSGLDDLSRLASNHSSQAAQTPPATSDQVDSLLALPISRPSESSQSDGSSGSGAHDQIYGTATTANTTSSHTTFFKLPRRNKNRNSLFPLPVKIPPPDALQRERSQDSRASPGSPASPSSPATPRASTSAFSAHSFQTPESRHIPSAMQRRYTEASPPTRTGSHSPRRSPHRAMTRGSLFGPEPNLSLFRGDSQRSHASSTSSPLQPPARLGARDRASTAGSFGRISHDMDSSAPWNGSQRTSTSTAGRASLGGFLNLARFRQSSDPHSPRHSSPGSRSKANSFALSRETLVVPEREEGDTPGKYLDRLEAAVPRSTIAGILSKSADPFAQAVLRSYCRRFAFFGEPIDMSLRKFLLEAELPKETQQIDRVVQAFADRYHECNPGIFQSPEQAYIVGFSLLMLHTDAFNKNNKHKMTKPDYVRNTSGQGVNEDILACFYDNICYTPFVHFEEDVDIHSEKALGPLKQQKKRKLKEAAPETAKASGPIDPYTLLVEQKLDMIRPNIKDSINMDDPYSYLGSQGGLDAHYLQRAFTHTGTLQIISARSRPTAYSQGQMAMNGGMMVPNGSMLQDAQGQAGLIDIKITKVGTLWRKATKKKKARSPWQEWGAILTGSQLYLFKNAHWAKGLLHQFTQAQKHGAPRTPVIFKPPLQEFKPDALVKIDDAVALTDKTYTRHKHSFVFVRPGGQEEILLADNEGELNDWLGLINYAAAFRAAGVRIRGMVGGAEDTKPAELARIASSASNQPSRLSEGEVALSTQHRGLTSQLHKQIMAARRQIMIQKINEREKDLNEYRSKLDDILRNARHLQILAPIVPRARDDVVYSAGMADAQLKWTRRDIWRTKCHKDILAMDVQQDGVSASEATLQPEPAASEEEETSKMDKAKGLLRLNSKNSANKSPTQSPQSSKSPHSFTLGRPSLILRPSTSESDGTFMGEDVFRTPPESATHRRSGDAWYLPPLQLDVEYPSGHEHRGSIDSTMLSVQSHSPRAGTSFSNTSEASSIQQTPAAFEANVNPLDPERVTPAPSIDDRDLQVLANGGRTPEPAVTTSHSVGMDGASSEPHVAKTPENRNRSSGVRRSLQKTLRDAHHHGNTHKHRRGKESESTVRSSVGPGHEAASEELEGTPGLERAKGRFILHGKQASVIQFGPEWPNDRMKARREQWRSTSGDSQPSGTSTASVQRKNTDEQSQHSTAPSVPSQVVEDLSSNRGGTNTSVSGDSFATTRSASLTEDLSVAEAYPKSNTIAASPATVSSSDDDNCGLPDGFDLSSFDLTPRQGSDNRVTVIGPKRSFLDSNDRLLKGDDVDGIGTVVLKDSASGVSGVSSLSAGASRDQYNRRTVIGPSPVLRLNGDVHDTGSGGEEGEGVSPIEDDELRRLSTPPPPSQGKAVRVA